MIRYADIILHRNSALSDCEHKSVINTLIGG